MGALLLYGKGKTMIEGKTKKGFIFKLDEDIKDDMELLEGLIALDNGEVNELPKVLTALLGKDQKEALYNFYRNKKTGRVSIQAVMAAFGEIFQQIDGDVKNL